MRTYLYASCAEQSEKFLQGHQQPMYSAPTVMHTAFLCSCKICFLFFYWLYVPQLTSETGKKGEKKEKERKKERLRRNFKHARRLSLQNKFVGSTLNSKFPLLLQSLNFLRFIPTSVNQSL